MTSTEEACGSEAQILKVDTRGRGRVTRERREALLAEYDGSSMSGAAFAEWAGIKYPTLMYWLAQRRRWQPKADEGSGKRAEMSWVEAVVEGGAGSDRGCGSPLEIALPGGASLRVSSPEGAVLAAEVLRHLGVGGRC